MPRVHAPAGYGIEEVLHITCSCVHTGKHSFVTTSREAVDPYRRVCGNNRGGRVAPARSQLVPTPRRQSGARELRREGARARSAVPARSVTARCRTRIETERNGPFPFRSVSFPSVRADSFAERQRSESCPRSRLWPRSWPGEASRPIAVSRATCEASRPYCRFWSGEASRPLEACIFGRARSVPDCLASLRSSERTQRELAPSVSGRGVE